MVAAIRSRRGASRRLLEATLDARGLKPLVPVPLFIEYEAVMTRPEHLRVAGLTATEAGRVLDAVAAVAEPIRLAFLWRPMLPDPADDMVLETAVDGRAEGIVTFNRRDFVQVQRQFGIAVLSPADAIRRLEEET